MSIRRLIYNIRYAWNVYRRPLRKCHSDFKQIKIDKLWNGELSPRVQVSGQGAVHVDDEELLLMPQSRQNLEMVRRIKERSRR